MLGVRLLPFVLLAAGCGSVHNSAADASPGTPDSGADAAPACGARGQACCAGGTCEARASCDGTACIAADVWASGVDGTFDFNGGSWTHPLIAGSSAQLPAVNGLWGTTSTFLVGVGAGGAILRLDGTGWHRDKTAVADGTGTFYAVAGSGPNDIWAVGDNHFSHFIGTGWAEVTPPYVNEPFYAVWLSGPDEGWAVGSSGILAHLTGGAWTFVSRSGGSFNSYGVWGSGPKDVWLVGHGHSLVTGSPLLIRHYDGTAWSDGRGMLDPGETLPPLKAVWGSDATHVWAVGDQGTIVFWDGTLWKSVLSGTTDDLSAVWGSGPSDVWVAGKTSVRHFNGRAWAPIPGLSSPPVALWLSKE